MILPLLYVYAKLCTLTWYFLFRWPDEHEVYWNACLYPGKQVSVSPTVLSGRADCSQIQKQRGNK